MRHHIAACSCEGAAEGMRGQNEGLHGKEACVQVHAGECSGPGATFEVAVSLLFAVMTPHTPSAIRMQSRTAGIAIMRGLSQTEEYRIWV